MMTLRASALEKAKRGETTFEEAVRVTHADHGGAKSCPSCERGVESGMVACPWCGVGLDSSCTGCDKQLDPEWRVCPWCRTPAGATPSVPAQRTGDASLPRLLVVDDDPSVRAYVATALSGTVEVDSVSTASEGLDRAATGGYDGLLIDQVLPDLTGIEMVRLLRGEARTAALPLMLFTGAARDGIECEARNAGADDYLTKPVEPLLLEERILALVQRSARLPH